MHRIQSTLPALGTIPIDFHNESFEVVKMMGDKEFSRLRKVAHLGIVSSIFTGANHSREEYMLLQCAVIGLLAKLHKGNESFALSSTVKLNRITNPVSSGEELLKIWALLGNYGHTKFTYGVERGILQAAKRNDDLYKWITNCKNITDIKNWCKKVIDEYQDTNMHYVICLARLQFLRERKYYHYIRNLVLPVEDLFPNNKSAQFKINRLRDLFSRIRMLCMATLDSYYSHQPISIQLNSAILGLSEYTPPIGETSSFEKVLIETNSWLAEELYLHPRSCAATTSYQIKAEKLISERFSKCDTPDKKKGFLLGLIHSGIGGNPDNILSPLVRLKFENTELFDRLNLNILSKRLQRQIAFPPKTYISVSKNPFNGNLYFDIFRRNNECNINDVSRIYSKVLNWLLRQLNKLVKKKLNDLIPKELHGKLPSKEIEDLEKFFSTVEIEKQLSNVFTMLNVFINNTLPDNLKSKIKEFVPTKNRELPILVKLEYKNKIVFDQITDKLKTHITQNPQNLSADSLQEIKALNSLVKRSKAKFILVCTEKFVIHNKYNEIDDRDELDGIIIEVFEDELRFTIIEAKNLGSASKNENKAYKQLDKTRKIISSKIKAKYKRQKIKRLGAYLRYSIPIDKNGTSIKK